MTDERARTIANVVLVSAGVAAAVVVVTTPPLRRLAAAAIRQWLGGASVPEVLVAEVRRAWAATAS
jgi:hypothetical protein